NTSWRHRATHPSRRALESRSPRTEGSPVAAARRAADSTSVGLFPRSRSDRSFRLVAASGARGSWWSRAGCKAKRGYSWSTVVPAQRRLACRSSTVHTRLAANRRITESSVVFQAVLAERIAMPELPEVEVARRNLELWLHHARVVEARVHDPR